MLSVFLAGCTTKDATSAIVELEAADTSLNYENVSNSMDTSLNDSISALNSTICPDGTIVATLSDCPKQKCSDGTEYGQCSTNKPKFCSAGYLIDYTVKCGCQAGETIIYGNCFKSCSDGTTAGACSSNKPKYCEDGNLVDNATQCGCSSGYIPNGTVCALKPVPPKIEIVTVPVAEPVVSPQANVYCKDTNCDKISTAEGRKECYYQNGKTGSSDTSCCLMISGDTSLKDSCLSGSTILHSAWAMYYGSSGGVEDYCQYVSDISTKDSCYSIVGSRLGTKTYDWCAKISTVDLRDQCYSGKLGKHVTAGD